MSLPGFGLSRLVPFALCATLISLAGLTLSPGARAGKTAPTSAAAGPVPLKLVVRERGPGLPWQFRLTNTSDQTVRLVADPRLLWFEVEVPGKKKRAICRLPKELFPTRADRRFVRELEPGKSFRQRFDPRLYCFATKGQWRLVPGAVVHPHFGWKVKTKTRWVRGRKVTTKSHEAPFAAAVLKASKPTTSFKVLSGGAFSLDSAYARWAKTRIYREPATPPTGGWRKPRPRLRLKGGNDARWERNARITLELKNPDKKKSLVMYFRREMVSFEVMGPDGLVTCSDDGGRRHPEAQSFMTLRPGRKITLTSRLAELCPRGTFDRPGLYLINARYDARHKGRRFGLDAFTGRAVSRVPVALRIRKGEKRFRGR